MITVEEVARSVLAAINSDANYLLAAQWVNNRYRQLCSRSRFRHLRQVGEVTIPAAVTAGVATVTQGLSIVTGDAAAQAVWTNALAGRSFRAANVWHEIESVVGGQLRLTSIYTETSKSSTYKIVQRYTLLDSEARWIGEEMVHMRRLRVIRRRSLAELSTLVPSRQHVGGGPELWAEAGRDVDGILRIEAYPYSTNAEVLHYVFWPVPPVLPRDGYIPNSIDPHVLREGALIDAIRHEMFRALRAGNVTGAELLRNDYRTQATAWERNVLEAIRTDRGTDDVTFILERAGVRGSRDIVTAYDQVLSNWPR